MTREATGYANSVPDYDNGDRIGTETGLAHNLALVDGLGPLGYRYRAAGPSVVRRLESRPAYVYADVLLTDAYQVERDHFEDLGNHALVSIEREFLFVRPLETLVVLDRMELKSPDGTTAATDIEGTFLLHLETTPTIEDTNHLLAVNGTQALRVTTLIPTSGGEYRQVPEEVAFAQRIELDYAGGAASECNTDHSCIYLLHALQARDATAPDLETTLQDSDPSQPNSGTFTVTLHPATGSDAVIVFQKGMSSVEGSITIDGTTSPLRSDIQPVSVTEHGVIWN